jgi:flagellar biosynthesis/type III secretory pathway protein FliH
MGVVEMIGKTPEERMREEDRRKAEMDFRSFVADAREDGRAEGYAELYAEGYAEGFAEGFAEGQERGLRQSFAEHVQSFQRLLGETVVPKEDLMKLESDALKELSGELEKRILLQLRGQ